MHRTSRKHQRRAYERLDLLKVGNAKTLTLGATGSTSDGSDCKKDAPADTTTAY